MAMSSASIKYSVFVNGKQFLFDTLEGAEEMRRRRHAYDSLKNKIETAFSNEVSNQLKFVLSGDCGRAAETLMWISEGKFYSPDNLPTWTYETHRKGHWQYKNPVQLVLQIRDEERSFYLHVPYELPTLREPSHVDHIVWERDKELVGNVLGLTDPAYVQLANVIETELPIRLQMLQIIKEANECLEVLDERASDQELLHMFPAIPNIVGTQKLVIRTKGVSAKRQKCILEGEWDTTVNPPIKTDPVPHLESFNHALAYISLKKMAGGQ
jgi:hypothetical protein